MIYFISGLGADHRVFSKININNHQTKHIKWIKPFTKEPISQYAQRLTKQINLGDEVILIGVSFGGIIAQEISKIIDCNKVIIISSIQSHTQLPLPIKFARLSQIQRLVPIQVLKWSNRLTASYFFSVFKKEEKILLKQIVNDTDPIFLKWSINQIVNWRYTSINNTIYHIHGDKDRIFPISNVNPDNIVENGGHLMIYTNSKEINTIINTKLSSL